MLLQDTKNANGRINWTPAMIENIRLTREKALEQMSSTSGVVTMSQGAPGTLTKYWRHEWESLYPELDIDWRQVISRYHYHFGAEKERRDSQEAPGGGQV